jgi:hypothetical protein
MAQKTVVLLEDDLDGGVATETVTFSLDGVSYEMDLSEQNAERLRGLFGPYVEAGRRLGGRSTTSTRSRATGAAKVDPTQLAAIRAWARGRGLEINDRGRIPGRIIEQYNAEATAPPAPAAAAAEKPEKPEKPTRGRRGKNAADLQFSERP